MPKLKDLKNEINNYMDNQAEDSKNNKLEELERQLERSGLFSHTTLSRQAERINEIESFLYGLIDTLTDKGVVEVPSLEETVKQVREETLKKKEHFHTGIAIRLENPEEAKEVGIVNCEERIPICKAICCKLNFALSVPEIESGKVKWDLGEPYFIRHNKNGYCSHMDVDKKCCSIYKDRPKVCSKYSCAKDERIWKDFEKMELNTEWIEANLQESKVQLKALYMIPEQKIEYKSKIEKPK